MLEDRMKRIRRRAKPLTGTIYRSSSPKYANTTDLITGEGSRRAGGRWNPIGIAVVYGSLTPETAMVETLAHANYYRLPAYSAMPRTFVAVEFTLSDVLDITNGRNRQALGVSAKRILECDWRWEVRHGKMPLTQTLGEAALAAGFEALLVPSAADWDGANLVVFVDNLQTDSSLELISADQLGGT